MDRRTFLSTAIVGTSTLSGCLSTLPWSNADTPLPDVPTGSWTQYGATGANTFAPNASAPARGNLAWTSDEYTSRQPAVSDGTVYMTNFDPSKDGSVLALDAQDGTEQWRTTLNADGQNGIVIVDGRCIVAHDTDLVALDPQSGEQIWTQTTGGLSFSELLVADESTGTVLVASGDGIEAFRAENGKKRWETELHQIVRAPAAYDGQVFAIGNVDGARSLVSLSLEDGSKRWQNELRTGPESADPVATQHGVVVSDDGSVVVHDRESGERSREIHSFDENKGGNPKMIAADDGTVFVTSSSGVVAVDINAGTEQWHRDSPVYDPGICVGEETVVLPLNDPEFTSRRETISALDRESGEMRWYYNVESAHGMRLCGLVDGAVFFYSTNIGLGVLGDVEE